MKNRFFVPLMVAGCILGAGSALAENRIVTLSETERVAIFDEAGTHTFKVPANITGTAEVLVVGGGGGGGGISGGGGGGGQVVQASNVELTSGAELDVVVAAGGSNNCRGSGGNGGTSSFLIYTAIGGGGGGGGWSPVNGSDGANGGGAGGNGDTAMTGGAATVEGGFPGGASLANYWNKGGGGGAAEAGHSWGDGVVDPGCGGAGIVSDITGEEVMYGYGGGAMQGKLSGAKNEWGKGDDGTNLATQGQDGTGGGGGAGRMGNGSIFSAAGGTGTVIIRYAIDATALSADFSADVTSGVAPLAVSFTASIEVPAEATPTLTWDFGDGSDPVVSEGLSIAHTYTEMGTYTVVLTLAAAGKEYVKTCENFVSVAQGAFYVNAASENPAAPYATAETAATTLSDALALATTTGQKIYVAPGTYESTSGTDSFNIDASAYEITNGVSIVGTGASPSDVVFTRSSSSHRLFYVNHAAAKIKNVTIANGWTNGTKVYLGGNVYIGAAGGTFEDCIITGGSASYWAAGGGNVAMFAGRLNRCVVSNGGVEPNSLSGGRKGGSGIYMKGGIVENSLITGNKDGYTPVVMFDSSKLANCTIAGNTGTVGAAVYVGGASCKVVNCAIGNNTVSNDSTGHGHVWLGANESLLSCFVSCATEVELGNDSVQSTSLNFVSDTDFHLGAASVCRDAAHDYATSGATSETDLDGNARQSGTAIDVGCYEFDADSLSADFSANAAVIFEGATVTFTAVVSGGTEPYTLEWDFDGDGVVDRTTSELTTQWTYDASGVYTVSLTVGAVSAEKASLITVGPSDIYVDDDSEEEGVYKTMQEAYAAAVDGTTVHVAPGEYLVDGDKLFQITKAVRLIGEGTSPDDVVLRQKLGWKRYMNFRTLSVENANAFVANMTIADGSADNAGLAGCLLISAAGGTVSNCVVRGGVIDNTQGIVSAGVLIQNGLLTHSVVSNCTVSSLSYSNGVRAQAIYAEGNARVENCFIQGSMNGIGATVVVSGASASMKNCTVVDSVVGYWVQNRGTWYETNVCHAVQCSAGSVVNTAVYNAKRDAVTARTATGEVEYEATDYAAFGPTESCFTACASEGEAAVNESCFVLTSADFRYVAKGDFRPKATGVLCDNGTEVAGWNNLIDLLGKKRVQGKSIDIGCYECLPSGLVIIVR